MVRLQLDTCPADSMLEPGVMEWLGLHARMRMFPGTLPRAGGLEDQDALTMRALSVLYVEDVFIGALNARTRSG